MSKIVLIDYGMGNLNSVKKKLDRLKTDSLITRDEKEILEADKLIIVGVGHFAKAMKNIENLNLIDVLNEVVLIKKKPILGICLGMQLMATHSEEGDYSGLNWIEAEVKRIQDNDPIKFKVPHTGWNEIIQKKQSSLMKDIPNNAEFYFVHAYYFEPKNPDYVLNETDYAFNFTSAVEKENIFGVQYHPEKSHDVGEVLLNNFISI